MQRFLFVRLFHAIIALFAVSIIVFALARVSGDPLDVLLDDDATEEDFARVSAYWGLDKPLPIQYFRYLGNIFTGNFGESIRWNGRDALGLVMERMPATLELALLSLLVSAALALPIGVVVAVKKDSAVDYVGKIIALLGQSLPAFWLGLILMWIFAVQFGLLPTSGRGSIFPNVSEGSFKHLILPAITLGSGSVAALMRLIRSSMLEVLDTEYVKLARIKGIPEWKVVWKHCLRNATITPLTHFGLILGGLMTGSVVTETVFNWPGVGLLAIDALRAKDFQVVQTVVVFFAAIHIAANLGVDVLYAYVDPRIRYTH